MAKIKEKKLRAKKTAPAKKNSKKITVRVVGKKNTKPPTNYFVLDKKKKIVEKEIIKNEQKEESLDDARIDSQANRQIAEAQIERSKQIIMWSGVAFFMILIGSVWIYILANSINEGANTQSANSSSELKDTLAKSMQEFKDSMEAFKELKNSMASTSTLENSGTGNNASSTEINNASTTATSTLSFKQTSLPHAENIGTSTMEKNDIAELRKKLEELEKKLQEIK
jgi:hypothetical protein